MKMKNLILFFTLCFSLTLQAKLIDKIVGLIDEKNISLSEVQRVQKTINGRREISPVLYNDLKTSQKEIINYIFKTYITRKELEKIGYAITEQRVDGQIANTLSRIGINKKQLINQLMQNGLSFEEYKEVIKASMEFNLFTQKIISPLVVISEQEIKSLYIKKSSQKMSQTIQYELYDYILEAKNISPKKLTTLRKKIQKTLDSGSPVKIKNIELIDIGKIKSSSLDKKIQNHLKKVEEGHVAKPLKLANTYHFFFVKKKEAGNSDEYDKVKSNIANYLYEQKIKDILETYYERKMQDNYYTKYL